MPIAAPGQGHLKLVDIGFVCFCISKEDRKFVMLAHSMVLVGPATFQFEINPPRDFHPLISLTVLHPSKMMTLSRQLFGWTEVRYVFFAGGWAWENVPGDSDETNDKC